MKITGIVVVAVVLLCGCANLHQAESSGFTCMAGTEECDRYLRTGNATAPARVWAYRPRDEDFTVIHSNRGPVTIYRKGNTYWVNDRRR